MAIVVSKTEESNAVSTYFVSCLAGPKVNRRRVAKGDAVELTEHQARDDLASGALVTEEGRVDDPWGEVAAAKAKAEADAKAAAEAKAAADAQAAADKAAEEARAAAEQAGQHHDDPPATPPASSPAATPPAADAHA